MMKPKFMKTQIAFALQQVKLGISVKMGEREATTSGRKFAAD